MMHIYYRISNNSYSKNKLERATKERCLKNFLENFKSVDIAVNIIADNVTDPALMNFLSDIQGVHLINTSLNNAQSFKYVLEKSLELPENDIVYFVEDDYFHLAGSRQAIEEGIELADYVTLYDAPDKYVNHSSGGHNQFIHGGGEQSLVVLSKSRHWKFTNSTTMTFAAKVKTLKQDYAVWLKYLLSSHPYDYQAFLELGTQGRRIASPLPGFSTHCELDGLAPLCDWNSI